ncbi:hypothetical protein ACFFX1_02235 [Dactylosporangium sucinum]|uniref:Uncharacterized protein n=1 Tax=Dactylosporangium sucinum TaxID=1424081 RepID=A0A917WI31_9ACTN|nr:hypothetical protein [Dactylosporangium sucinum]GGM08013.1 hypothetical protein GCM10007977_006340 [Dactylosporangium sucinum]
MAIAFAILLIAVAVILLIARQKKLEAAVVAAILGIVVAVFAKPIENAWDGFFAQHDTKNSSPAAPTSGTKDGSTQQQAEPTSPENSPTYGSRTPTPGAKTSDVRVDQTLPDVDPTRIPEPVYLADKSRVNGGNAIVLKGARSINGKEYANSIAVCSELTSIPNINCNSDKSDTWWAEYVAPQDMHSVRAMIGLSDTSPGDCRDFLQLELNGAVVFDKELVAGGQFDRSWPVQAGTRLTVRVRPIAGTGRCLTVLGDARFTP